jgi:hypothetical protein
MDAISFNGDKFGNVTPANTSPRGLDPTAWTQYALNRKNETIFKNGLDLLTDIQSIRCNKTEAKAITTLLKTAGILQLPDGRPVSDLFTP